MALLVAPTAGAGIVYRVNAGGPGTGGFVVDTDAKPSPFHNNQNFAFKKTVPPPIDMGAISDGTPEQVFVSHRYDPNPAGPDPEMEWHIPVPPAAGGTLTLRLYFAEIFNSIDGPGKRVFDVLVEGALCLDDYDVWAETGGNNVAIMEECAVADAGANGTLDIRFRHVPDPVTKVSLQNPMVSAIQILSSDNTAPNVTAPGENFKKNTRVAGNKVPVKLSWTGDDPSGIDHYELQQGGETVAEPKRGNVVRRLGQDSYLFSVKAFDRAGNSSAFVDGSIFQLLARQENSSQITYRGPWRRVSQRGSYGGKVNATARRGARALYEITVGAGEEIDLALVSTLGRDRGKAKVILDGAGTTVNLYSRRSVKGRLIYTANNLSEGTHRLVLKALGKKDRRSSGKRVDLDAIVQTVG